eukprot:4316238-Alexandrium_andersonii.AAC.1
MQYSGRRSLAIVSAAQVSAFSDQQGPLAVHERSFARDLQRNLLGAGCRGAKDYSCGLFEHRCCARCRRAVGSVCALMRA